MPCVGRPSLRVVGDCRAWNRSQPPSAPSCYAALFELAVTASSYDEDDGRYDRADHKIRPEQIADVVRKLGGDPDVPLFGADDLRD